MDEKILQRIIPLLIAVVVLVAQYAIRNQKKKNMAASVEPPVSKEADIFPEIDFNKQMKETRKEVRKEKLEPVVIDNIAEKEDVKLRKSAFSTIKQNMKQNMKQNIKSSFDNVAVDKKAEIENISFTEEELKKAIIYSEILTPKHF